ncbi:spermidine synthase [Hydrogenimonas sp.]|nr:spermidine synthase [Hydrogenimonas sp.]
MKSELGVKERVFERDGVEVYDSGYFGKILLFGGKALYCEHDSAMRHEIMAHIAMCTHEEPSRVLVVDGGDGALAHELLKHKDVKIDVVERNGAVPEAASAAGLYTRALENERVSLTVGSVDHFVSSAEDESYDIVLLNRFDEIDFSDETFFTHIGRILTPKGLVVSDASSQLFDMSGHKAALSALCDGFKIVMPFCYTSMVQPGGERWFAMGSRFFHPTADINLQRADLTDGYSYYNSDLHPARFALPTSIFEQLKEYIRR